MRRTSTTSRHLAALAAATLLGACASGGSASPGDSPPSEAAVGNGATQGQTEVRIKDFVFVPEDLEVTAGTTVSWTNDDFFGHTVTSGTPQDPTEEFDGVLGEVAQAEGTTFEHTFEEPGTYDYFCRFHPRMIATITVTD